MVKVIEACSCLKMNLFFIYYMLDNEIIFFDNIFNDCQPLHSHSTCLKIFEVLVISPGYYLLKQLLDLILVI